MAQETKKNSHLRHQVISSTQGRTTRHNSGAKRPALAPICLPVKQLGGVEACFRPRNHHLSDTTDMLSHCRATKATSCSTEKDIWLRLPEPIVLCSDWLSGE